MTVLPKLLTAAEATKLTEASRKRGNASFDAAYFESMKTEWDRQIRHAADAGSRSISIVTPYSSFDGEIAQTFADHFSGLGYRVDIQSHMVPNFPAPSDLRIMIVVTWETATRPEKAKKA